MRYLCTLLLVGVVVAFAATMPRPSQAAQALNILACEPEWAALAHEIGGDRVDAVAATHARQDPHYIRARPSLIAKARRADLIICSGAGLEAGWLPILLQRASANVQPNQLGYILAAEHVPILDKPTIIDRSLGDIHPEGNPHVHLNPHNILLIAKLLTMRLGKIDPPNRGFYQKRLQDFTLRWQQAIKQWEADSADLRGKNIVVHHRSFIYLLNWLGMPVVASLEPKAGVPPNIAHLEKLLQQLKTTPALAIIRTPYEADAPSLWLAKKTNLPAIMLPYTIDGDAQSGDLFALFERTINLLKSAAQRSDARYE